MSKLKLDINVLKYIALASGKKDVRYYLNGIYFGDDGEGNLILVGTDGHRLHLSVTTAKAPEKPFVINIEDLKEILTIKSKTELEFGSVGDDEYRIGGRIVKCDYATKYPDYRRILLNETNSDKPLNNAMPFVDVNYLMDASKGLKGLGLNHWYEAKILIRDGYDGLDCMQLEYKGTKTVLMGVQVNKCKKD